MVVKSIHGDDSKDQSGHTRVHIRRQLLSSNILTQKRSKRKEVAWRGLYDGEKIREAPTVSYTISDRKIARD